MERSPLINLDASMPTILLTCPECRRADHIPRQPWDPPGATEVRFHCCASGSPQGGTRYFNAEGHEIPKETP